MKKASVFLLLMLLAALLGLMTACNGKTADSTGENSKAGSTPVSTPAGTPDGTTPNSTEDSIPPVEPGTLTIAGKPIADYTIVYAKSEYAALRGRLNGTEYDFYRLTAEKLAADLKELTGAEFTVKQDTSTPKGELEILVGPTNRAESAFVSELDIYDYVVRLEGSKLVVGGGNNITSYTGNLKTYYTYASTYHAFDDAAVFLRDELQKGDYDIGAGFDRSGSRHFTTIACIGDSITEGVLASDWNYCAYPAVLQRYLWQDYVVINYGNGGKTMRNDLNAGWMGTPQHAACRKNLAKIDLALVMLGTNDSGYDAIWTGEDDERYLQDARTLIQDLTEGNEKIKSVILNCPAYYGNGTSASLRVRSLQAALPDYLKENGYPGVMFYDMHAFTDKNLGSALFPDAIHPNDKGYALMAEGLSKVIPAFVSGEWDFVPEPVEVPKGEAPDVPVPAGSRNLLGKELDALYPLSSAPYLSWYMGGAPYIFMDLNAFSGTTVTNIEFPVSSAVEGSRFTVSVVKYSYPKVTETLKTYTLTADFSCAASWVRFGDLSIEVPEGYTLGLGSPGDTLIPLYLNATTAGYSFYGTDVGSINTTTLAFNIYGKGGTGSTGGGESDKGIAAGSENLLGRELDREFPVAAFENWAYDGAPYLYMNLSLFEGRKITDLEIPVKSSPAGGRMTLSVVRFSGRITETLMTVTLICEEAVTSPAWVLFHDLDLAVPEGCTLAFGASSDTVRLGFLNAKVPGYEFYNREGGVNSGACLAFNVYGTKAELPDRGIAAGSENLLPLDIARAYPIPVPFFADWAYGGAPYVYKNLSLFEGKTITDIEAPVRSAPAGGKMTVSVVKLGANGYVSETKESYILTADRALSNEWVHFSGLNIEVPEGYTLAFGAPGDTVLLLFINMLIDGYTFYGAGNGTVNDNASIVFNVYGKSGNLG